MAEIQLNNAVFYADGESGVSAVVGYESMRTRVARYTFTVPAPGASSVSVKMTAYHENGEIIPIRFYIGTDPDSHANAGAAYAYTGTTAYNGKDKIEGSTNIILTPGVTYYIWFFPAVNNFGWYYLSATGTLTTSGGSASQPSASAESVEMGQTVIIYTNRASEEFTHTLTYSFGGTSGTIKTGVQAAREWTPPIDLAVQIPNQRSGIATVYCTTYAKDGTQVGSPLKTEIELTVPESLTPTVSKVSITDSTGANSVVGIGESFVQNVSKLVVDVTCSGQYGAKVTTVTMKLDGKTFTGGLVSKEGSLKLEILATDSRGLTGKAEKTVVVEAYTAPSVIVTASRCTEDGTADDTGEFSNVTITGKTTAFGGNNTATLIFTHKTQESASVSTGEFTYSKRISAPSTEVLTLKAVLHDKLSEAGLLKPGEYSMPLSVGYATMDLLKGGKGIAFGATATQEGFSCAMKARFLGGIETNYVYASKNGGDCNSYVTETHLFAFNMTNKPSAFNYGWFDVWRASGNGFSPNGAKPIILQRFMVWNYISAAWRYSTDGGETFSEWAYENPPMQAGIEYLTTKRYNGTSPVYTKIIKFGALPNQTSAEVAHNITAAQFTGVRCVAYRGSTEALEISFSEDAKCQLTESGTIKITLAWKGAAYSADVILEYIK